MEKIVKVDLENIDDLYEKYNKSVISKELINYIIENTPRFKKKDDIKVVVNNKSSHEIDFKALFIQGLQREYKKIILKYHYNNFLQLIYFIIGIIILFLSTLIKEMVLKEIILISGWFLIGAIAELELFSDMNIRKKRRILKKLLNSKIVVNNVIN